METALGLTVASDDPLGDLEDLLEWLRDEPELRRTVSQVSQPPRPGHMGLSTELVVLLSGVPATVLVSSLKAWLNRPRGKDAVIKIRRADGVKIEVTVKREDDVGQLVATLLEAESR